MNIQIKSTESVKLRVMHNSNPAITLDYIKDLKSSGSPYHFANISSSASGVYFFNSFRNSKITISHEVDFQFSVKDNTKIDEVKSQTAGYFDVIACIKWLSNKTTPNNKTNTLREAVIYDDTGNIAFTVWGEQIDQIEEGQ